MTFDYPDISTITHLNGRWYDTPHGFYPSITTILGFTEPPEMKASLKRWQDALGTRAQEISKAATDRGTNVHLLAERYLKKQPVDAPIDGHSVPEADMASFKALKLKLDKIDEVWGQECALYSTSIEIAGRCDLVGTYKRLPVIIDFKTAGRLKGHKDIGAYKVQLAFYALAHNEMFGTTIEDGIILMVADTGFPMEFKVKLADHMEELRDRAAAYWLHAVNSSI
jgi:genome maintenance exonuclease 1